MNDNRVIEDGFGGCWVRCHYEDCDLHVVRPGKVQCSNCDVDELRAERAMLREALAGFARCVREARASGASEVVIPLDAPEVEGLFALIECGTFDRLLGKVRSEEGSVRGEKESAHQAAPGEAAPAAGAGKANA